MTSARDTNFFKLLFEAIDQFYKFPEKEFIIIRNRFVGKKFTLRLIRNLLPKYRVFTDDKELVSQLFLNRNQDINLRNILSPDAPPILSEEMHDELDAAGTLPPDQQDSASEQWLTKWFPGGKELPGGPLPEGPLKDLSSRSQITAINLGSSLLRKAGNTAGGLLRSGGGLAVKAGGAAAQVAGRGLVAVLGGVGLAGGGAIVIAFIIVLLLIFVLPVIFSLLQTSSLLPPFEQRVAHAEPKTPIGGGGEISQCTFYRGGDTAPGLQFRISQWPTLINEVSSSVGIPNTALAAILRVECGSCFYSNNPDYIRNDYDAHSSTVAGQPFALGVMQFYPPTFEAVFNRNRSEMATVFGKTSVRTIIDPQTSMASQNVLRIYSIRDSLIAAAYKIKNDAGSNPPYDRAAVERIVRSYFTQCEYTQGGRTFNYCDDVWNSMQGCQSPSPSPTSISAVASCPVVGGTILTPSYQAGAASGRNNGHCSTSYTLEGRCRTDCPLGVEGSRRAKAIDVRTLGQDILLPTIEGQRAQWTLVQIYNVAVQDGGGTGYIFDTRLGHDKWSLDMLHLGDTSLQKNQIYPSGTSVGRSTINHVHMTIGKNVADSTQPGLHTRITDCDPGWIPSDFMCQ